MLEALIMVATSISWYCEVMASMVPTIIKQQSSIKVATQTILSSMIRSLLCNFSSLTGLYLARVSTNESLVWLFLDPKLADKSQIFSDISKVIL